MTDFITKREIKIVWNLKAIHNISAALESRQDILWHWGSTYLFNIPFVIKLVPIFGHTDTPCAAALAVLIISYRNCLIHFQRGERIAIFLFISVVPWYFANKVSMCNDFLGLLILWTKMTQPPRNYGQPHLTMGNILW